jgi:hypothetical protein
MLLPNREVDVLLRDFPQIKLPYENLIHNKVFNSDVIFAIPEGKKYFLWFTEYNDKNCCFQLELNEKNNVVRVEKRPACFNSILCYNTILYGTVFTYEQNLFFTIEDIYFYKGNNISYYTWEQKLTQITDLLTKHISQVAFNNEFIVLGMPLFTTNINDLIDNKLKTPYKIKSIQYRHFNKKGCYLYQSYEDFLINKVKNKSNIAQKNNNYRQINCKNKLPNLSYTFVIKADIQNDIYHLYCDYNNNLQFYETAYIPNYTCSVMMNKLFRIIKENENLDALEESDDEDEFQNTNVDKYVNLQKEVKMICRYNTKFRKWFPVSIANNDNQIVQFQILNTNFK